MITIYPYQTQEVRDLAWACFSPTLLQADQLAETGANIADCELALTPARQAWLEQLDRDAAKLLEHISRLRSHRLGIYFEHLWHFFLEQDPAITLVAHNLPVRHQGRTLGEFDCIYYCHQRQRHFHLELAVKYFLSHREVTTDGNASACSEWLGPNAEDRLDLKVAHLMQRQILLSDNPHARECLNQLGISELSREVVIKGHLFQCYADPLPPPPGFNRDCTLGQWLEINQLDTWLKNLDAAAYLLLPKIKWLSSALCKHPGELLTGNELRAALATHFSRNDRPQLVVALDEWGWEQQRFFVTAADWPAATQSAPVRGD